MALVENNPQLADTNIKELYNTEEEQSAAVLQYYDPNVILAKRGLETWNLACTKSSKLLKQA